MNLVYVTGNHEKYISIKELFEKEGIDVDFCFYDFEEPEINDIEVISKDKVLKAYELTGKPCFVADSGFYIEDYPGNPGYPGAFVKRSGIAEDVDTLLVTMKDVKNRKSKFLDCLTFYDGVDFYRFYGISEGTIAYEKRGNNITKAKSNLWLVFVPNNSDKTLAEMTDYERHHRNDNHVSASEQFIKWYKDVYLKQPTRKLEQ